MNLRTKLGLTLLALPVLVLAAAACGDDDDDATPTTAAPAVSTAASTPTRAASPAASAAASVAASPSTAATTATEAALVKVGTTAKGPALTDAAGLSLYTFDNDTTTGKSACNSTCATNWPPVMITATAVPPVSGAAGAFSIITRDDGTKQVAYNNKPLYRWAADKAAGDTSGDGVGGVWHLAKP